MGHAQESKARPNTDTMEYLGTVSDLTEGEARLRETPGTAYFLFTRWNFNGRVWFAADRFHMEIWRHHARGEVLSETTPRALMTAACEKYGYD